MHRNGSDSTKTTIGGLRRGDLCLIAAALLLALLFLAWQSLSGSPGKTVEITVDGVLWDSYPIDRDTEISVEKDGVHNTVQIQDGYVYMKDADCPDKICVHHKKVKNVGETIVCLPHKVVVKVVGTEEDDQETSYDIITN